MNVVHRGIPPPPKPSNRMTACVFYSATENVHGTALRSHAPSDRVRSGSVSAPSFRQTVADCRPPTFPVLVRAAMVPFAVLAVACSAYLFAVGPGSS